MASSKRRSASQRATTARKIRKLQKAGLLSEKIDPNKAPSTFVKNKIYKYQSVIAGNAAAVKLSSSKKAQEVRRKIGIGGEGKVAVIAREKGEKFRVLAGDKIKSHRVVDTPQGKKTIDKDISLDFASINRPNRPGEQRYFTLPRRFRGSGVFSRRTFASLDELQYYVETESGQGVDFDEIEGFIEVESFRAGSRKEQQEYEEYLAGRRRAARKRKQRSRR